MKTILILLIVFFYMCSCYDDKGNYDYHQLNPAEVIGIDTAYRCFLLSRLVISPQINSLHANKGYSCMWLCYKNTKDGIDTLSCEKDLDYELTMDPAVYTLVFSYQDNESGVTKYISSKLTVESEYSRGWYVMKEKNTHTDLDFFSDALKSEDLMLKLHGQSLMGSPQCLGLIEEYNWLNEGTGELEQWNMCFALLSEQDLRVVRIRDLKILGDFNSLFYEAQSICRPEKWFGWDGGNAFINNGKVFTINTRLGVLGSARFSYEKEGDYDLAPVMTKKSQLCALLFDKRSGKFCTVTQGDHKIIYLESDEHSVCPASYPDMRPIYAGLLDEGSMWDAGKGYVVMEKLDGSKRVILYFDLVCLDNTGWAGTDAFKNRIMEMKEITEDMKLSKAECFGMNRTSKLLYFSLGDKLYYYDLENKREQEVKRLGGDVAIPAGEHIVMIKHIIFDNSYSAPDEYVNKLAVATSNGEYYKLYLFELVSDQLKEQPLVFEGTGIPREIVYMSSEMGNAYWAY